MSSYVNQGGLWDNQRKFDAKDPDFVGSINIGGTDFKLVGWMSSSTHPQAPNINLKVAPTMPQAVAVETVVKVSDDDIPF